MKVIFLDIDGVLNYPSWYSDDRNPGNLNGREGDLDPLCIDRVIKICEETSAKVVISSDWKLAWVGTKIRLSGMGLSENYVIDKTPDYVINRLDPHTYFTKDQSGYELSRGHEIDLWLSAHPECTNYVILDDRTDFTEDQQPHFIKVDGDTGLTDDNVEIAIMTLNHH